MFSLGVELFVEILQGIEPGGVHRQYLAHAENQNVRLLAGALERGFELVDRAEKERAEDAVNHHPFGNLFANERMVRAFGFGHFVNRGELSDGENSFEQEVSWAQFEDM